MIWDQIQIDLREVRKKWEGWGQWREPELGDAIGFLVTEAAEVMEAYLRTKDGYARNNPRDSDMHKIAIEAFDTIMMACMVLDALGESLSKVGYEKVLFMDDVRKMRMKQHTEVKGVGVDSRDGR